jgi:hypothetical protein
MARPLRIELAGASYFVTTRSSGEESVYADDADREAFVELIGRVCGRFGWLCYGYALLDDHYQLIVRTPKANLSKGMRQLNGVYTQYFNRRHGTVGPVFQGRFKAVIFEPEAYMKSLACLLATGPVDAGLARHARAWPWSSYRATIGAADAPEWLDVESMRRFFAKRRATAIKQIKEATRKGAAVENPLAAVQRQIYLGSPAFIAAVDRKIGRVRANGTRKPGRLGGRVTPLANYAKRFRERDRAMAAAYASGHYTMKEIGDHFGVHEVTVSRAVAKIEAEARG